MSSLVNALFSVMSLEEVQEVGSRLHRELTNGNISEDIFNEFIEYSLARTYGERTTVSTIEDDNEELPF